MSAAILAALGLVLGLGPSETPAPTPPQRASADRFREANDHRARAQKFQQEGDFKAARAEYVAGHAVWPNAVFSVELAHLCVLLDDPVQAREHIADALAHQEELGNEAWKARALAADVERRLGLLRVEVEPPDIPTRIFVSERPYTPPEPALARIGPNVVRVEADGFERASTEVSVASGAPQVVHVKLIRRPAPAAPTTTAKPLPGHIQLDARVTPAARVVLDDVDVGVTPLPASLDVEPGPHTLTLTRTGYEPARHDVNVVPGGTWSISQGLVPVPTPSATFVVAIEPEGVRVEVDGGLFNRRGNGTLSAPPGPHVLRLSKPLFEERVIHSHLLENAKTSVRLRLVPMPELRERRERRTVALVWAGVGAVAATGSVVGMLLDADARVRANGHLGEVERSFIWGAGGACDYSNDVDHIACDNRLASTRDSVRWHNIAFYGGLTLAGVGAVVTGLALWRARANADPADSGSDNSDEASTMTISLLPTPRTLAASLAVRLP